MRVESMHDKNNGFRLIGYRLIADCRDEERILNLGEWSVQREQFGPDMAIQILMSQSSAATPTAEKS